MFNKFKIGSVLVFVFVIGLFFGQTTFHSIKNNVTESLIPLTELAKITGSGSFENNQLFGGSIYNGSNWEIARLIITLSEKDKTGKVVSVRDYQFKPVSNIEPLSASDFNFQALEDYGVKTTDWFIKEAYGISKN